MLEPKRYENYVPKESRQNKRKLLEDLKNPTIFVVVRHFVRPGDDGVTRSLGGWT